jgi:hypothetical protein
MIALWGLIGLSLISVTARPIVRALGLPKFMVNLDALLTPTVVLAVVLAAVASWPRLPATHRALTVGVTGLVVAMTASWAVSSPRSLPSLALGSAMLLLLPLGLYLVAMATVAPPPHSLARRVVLLMVLLQLCVGLAQYIALAVAQKAPYAADLVDGTTSHNFWPVFALPASLALVMTGRDRSRFLWPIAVVLLAIYSEAKAALIIWLPIMAAVLGWRWVHRAREEPKTPRDGPRASVDVVAQVGIVAMAAAIVLIGLWWTPSVQGTWHVFVGHTRELEQIAENRDRPAAQAPDIREGISVVAAGVTSGPRSFVFGQGPANTTSHAAEVLTEDAQSGGALPDPGPLARQLLTGKDDIKFRDAQSTLLGIWGDIGTLGAGLYLIVTGSAMLALFRASSPSSRRGNSHAWSVALIALGILAGGTLLDWPEQASVVLPLMLTTLALCTDKSQQPSRKAREDQGHRDDELRPGAADESGYVGEPSSSARLPWLSSSALRPPVGASRVLASLLRRRTSTP